MLAYLAIVTIVVATHGYLVNERAELVVWESLLRTEMTHFIERRATDPGYQWSDTDALRLYGPPSDRPVPEAFASLSPGVHDDVVTPDGEFVVFVNDSPEGVAAIALEVSKFERGEHDLGLILGASTVAVVAILVFITHLGAGWVVRPLTSLAKQIASFAPDRPGQRVPVEGSSPREAEVIADALNGYLHRLDQFLVRERTFVNMASHELRTPITVIASSAEVALDRCSSTCEASNYLTHILTTARDMERLVSMLVALAKDPARLRGADETVDLATLIPLIVADHEFLARHKELSFELDLRPSEPIRAPTQVTRAAIGNLLRNAIENSDRGVIRIASSAAAQVTIADPGHGMSDEEMSAVYTQLARTGQVLGTAGIGIELISRLCEHLGWQLRFTSELGMGTTATLDFGAHQS
jgi:signal transduction histidine kinase